MCRPAPRAAAATASSRSPSVTGRPILPVALASSSYISLNNWSRMTINLPGSRLGGSIGDPIRVPAELNDEQLEHYRRQVERQLDIATADAYARGGVSAERATPPHALEPRHGEARAAAEDLCRLTHPCATARCRAAARRARARQRRTGATRRTLRHCRSHPRPSGQLAGCTRRASARPTPSCR